MDANGRNAELHPHEYVDQIVVEIDEQEDIPDEGELDPNDGYVEGTTIEKYSL